MPSRVTVAALLLGTFAVLCADGGQVDWSSSAFASHQRSDGAPLDDSFVFELGAFADGFVPTASNTAEWAEHWRVAQRTIYNAETQLFAASYVVETNAPPFGAGDLGYIWGLSADHPGEWLLVTSPLWRWPATGGANPPVSWTVGNAVTQVVGNINALGDPFLLQTGAVDPANPIAWVTAEAWRAAHFTAAQVADGRADWTADPDGDGHTNLTEMGLDTQPLVADEGGAPTVNVTAQDRLEMVVDKAPNHVLDYYVEVSGDLLTWSRDEGAVEVITNSASLLVVRDRTPLTAIRQRFIRLTIVLMD